MCISDSKTYLPENQTTTENWKNLTLINNRKTAYSLQKLQKTVKHRHMSHTNRELSKINTKCLSIYSTKLAKIIQIWNGLIDSITYLLENQKLRWSVQICIKTLPEFFYILEIRKPLERRKFTFDGKQFFQK